MGSASRSMALLTFPQDGVARRRFDSWQNEGLLYTSLPIVRGYDPDAKGTRPRPRAARDPVMYGGVAMTTPTAARAIATGRRPLPRMSDVARTCSEADACFAAVFEKVR